MVPPCLVLGNRPLPGFRKRGSRGAESVCQGPRVTLMWPPCPHPGLGGNRPLLPRSQRTSARAGGGWGGACEPSPSPGRKPASAPGPDGPTLGRCRRGLCS